MFRLVMKLSHWDIFLINFASEHSSRSCNRPNGRPLNLNMVPSMYVHRTAGDNKEIINLTGPYDRACQVFFGLSTSPNEGKSTQLF